jgi:hypothetical protein
MPDPTFSDVDTQVSAIAGETVAKANTKTRVANAIGYLKTATVNALGKYTVKTTNFTTEAGGRYACDVTGGAFTATLHATPADGDVVEIVPAGGSFATYNLTIARNGKTIAGLSRDIALTSNFGALLVYKGGDWKVVAVALPPGIHGVYDTWWSIALGCLTIQEFQVGISCNFITTQYSNSNPSIVTDGTGNAGISSPSWNSGILGLHCLAGRKAKLQTDGSLELDAIASSATPSIDSARIYSKVVGGTPQIETVTVVGTITSAGSPRLLIDAYYLPNHGKIITATGVEEDSASVIGGKLRAAAVADATINDLFVVGGSGADISLTYRITPGNDETFALTVDNGNGAGLTETYSVHAQAGTAGIAKMHTKDESGAESIIPTQSQVLGNVTETLHTASPNNTVNAEQVEVTGGSTNVDLVLTPKGTGAFVLGPEPDGTAVGGDKRGAFAVDLQLGHGVSSRVASGSDSFAAGSGCTASGTNAIAIGSGVTSSGDGSFAAGIQCNASAPGAFAIGEYSYAQGRGDTAVGRNAHASGECGFAHGFHANSTRWGQYSHSGGFFYQDGVGVAQFIRIVLGLKTTGQAQATLSAMPGGSTSLVIPAGKILHATITLLGSKSDGSAVARYLRQVCIKNVAGTTSLVGAVVALGVDEATGTTLSITADDTNDALKIEVTGIAEETWRWVASIEGTELGYGT